MMTTCRLLCALLVLALCCCSSVYAADAQLEGTENHVEERDSILPPPPPEPPTAKPPIARGSVTSDSFSASEDKQGKGNSESPGLGSSAESGKSAVERDSTVTEPQSNNAPNTIQTEVNNGTTGPRSGTSSSADQTDNNAKDVSATTTTTTKEPTTTTTTAPEAPSTTTTEAPAVSSTRAPSRLREIDGSLSSSAWVCAPLVLAASALAYTAVG
ncbi:putative mucin TcMUCII [Trypanosoma cruzi]|nr:putative mucin TcMUCII [Trypanosoma cruzi]